VGQKKVKFFCPVLLSTAHTAVWSLSCYIDQQYIYVFIYIYVCVCVYTYTRQCLLLRHSRVPEKVGVNKKAQINIIFPYENRLKERK